MTVQVLYFGILKDMFGDERALVELAPEQSVGDLIALLKGRAAVDARVWGSLAVAVNREYAQASCTLQDGDEVALLPPVSGGCDAD